MFAAPGHRRKGVACLAVAVLVLLCFNTMTLEWIVMHKDMAFFASNHGPKPTTASTVENETNPIVHVTGIALLQSTSSTEMPTTTPSPPTTSAPVAPTPTSTTVLPTPAKSTPSPPTTLPSSQPTTSAAPPRATPSNLPLTTPPLETIGFETVAIVTYVPDKHVKFVNQTQHMLWSSWNYSIHHVDPRVRGRTDLIIFAHRNVMEAMPPSCIRLAHPALPPVPSSNRDRCFVVEQTPAADNYWHRYGFMFSLLYLAEPAFQPLLMSYDRLLRTDTDVVITPAFLTFRPRQFVVGRGGYMYHDYTKARIKELAADINMTHQGLHSVGSTWFGNATLTLQMVPKMLEVAKFILDSPKYNVEQGFPRWHIGVTSMYAGELVVNHFIPKDNVWVNSASLDVYSNGIEKTDNVYHSHCWPGSSGFFTKSEYEDGEYSVDKFPRESLDIAVIKDYFMAMVLYGY
ncbi:hypothetical protein DYB28_014298 [Aphanomyces astaci]|uniref:DUF7164 domain-containing protein n=1 Tax=Aphanomyces astaci TaxID=112090 RepID=A0A9X8E3W8_APHAT|nr:hypothetical protein DYB28_014298 [Aphanomyces astaci]